MCGLLLGVKERNVTDIRPKTSASPAPFVTPLPHSLPPYLLLTPHLPHPSHVSPLLAPAFLSRASPTAALCPVSRARTSPWHLPVVPLTNSGRLVNLVQFLLGNYSRDCFVYRQDVALTTSASEGCCSPRGGLRQGLRYLVLVWPLSCDIVKKVIIRLWRRNFSLVKSAHMQYDGRTAFGRHSFYRFYLL